MRRGDKSRVKAKLERLAHHRYVVISVVVTAPPVLVGCGVSSRAAQHANGELKSRNAARSARIGRAGGCGGGSSPGQGDESAEE
jgi:hypothetical protein